MNRELLTKLLREAESAHAEYEKSTGKPDLDWPVWYAEYIISKLNEQKTSKG